MKERIAILGASRGIGAAIAKILEPEAELLLVSRKWQAQDDASPTLEKLSLDLTNDTHWDILEHKILEFNPSRLFYVAGGGPYGDYFTKNFKDHLWAFQLNLLTPARLLHFLGKTKIQQALFFGSAIAEENGDPFASSYSSAKHGLLGLIKSVNLESPNLDLRIYSPGYTATDLLPKSAQQKFADEILSPSDVARDFVSWAFSHDGEKHRIYRRR